jgi:hypothetical protein
MDDHAVADDYRTLALQLRCSFRKLSDEPMRTP